MRAEGKQFLNGIASFYETSYPHELTGVIAKEEFENIMNTLNDTIISYWPCNTCYMFGYVCAPCTFGLSLCCPGYCAGMAEQKAHQFMETISLKKKFYEHKVIWKIRKNCISSWVEISFPIELKETGIPEF